MPKININTKIERIGRSEAVRICNMAMRWCRRHLGVNKRRKYQPVWTIRRGNIEHLVGEYDAECNEILIYWDQCDNVEEIINTTIHEWTHQLQPILANYRKYTNYQTNPYEVEARMNETLYTRECWNTIKQKVNKKWK